MALPDPRRVLREAAERRLRCELMSRGGPAVVGEVLRVEQAGLVVLVPGRRFGGGEDLRIWLELDGRPYSFEASVVRSGVPVPDRSQDGVLLGFIDRWVEGPRDAAAAAPPGSEASDDQLQQCTVELVLPSGPALSLLQPPVHLVDLALREIAFTVPSGFHLVFVRDGRVRVRLALPARSPVEVSARVRTLSPGDGSILYGLVFEEVDDADGLREVVEEIGRRL